jgi:hypothetical protein
LPSQREDVRRRLVQRLLPGLCVGLIAACSGGGGGGQAAITAEPAPRYALSWQGQALGAWQLQAEPPEQAQAIVQGAALQLNARMALDAAGQAHCALAAAGIGFGDAQTLADGDSALSLTLNASRWDLGLGRFDTDLPQLAVVHHGERALFHLAGFQTMPGTAVLQWQRDSGWRWQLDGVSQTVQPELSPDSGLPGVRLSIDGCSEAMQQTVRIDSVQLSVR